jgi:hypothetical protein
MRHQLTDPARRAVAAGPQVRLGDRRHHQPSDPEFSKRRNEIDDALRELEAEIGRGAHPGEIEHIVLRTRPAKNHTPADDLVASWRERAARHGLDPDKLAPSPDTTTAARRSMTAALFESLAGPTGICAGGSVFSRSEAHRARQPPRPAGDDGVAAAVAVRRRPADRADRRVPRVTPRRRAHRPTTAVTPRWRCSTCRTASPRFAKGLHRGAHLVAD